MSGYQDRIQGMDRLLRIRRMRRAVYLALLVLTALLMYARVIGEGANLKPFFLPLDGILEIGLVMGLMGTILGLYLKNLEIKRAQRDSQRYLMSKYSMSRAATTAVIALFFGIILIIPATGSGLASALTEPARVLQIPSGRSIEVQVLTPDAFGVSFVRTVQVQGESGTVQVEVFLNNVSHGRAQVSSSTSTVLDIQPTGWTGLGNWTVVFTALGTGPGTVAYTMPLGLDASFFSTVPFLLFLYFAANLGWWFGLRPIRDRTKADALYAATDNVAQLDQGERAYMEYAMQPSPRAYPEAAIADPPPPPPSSIPPPPPGPAPAAILEPAAAPAARTPSKPAAAPDSVASFSAKGDTLMSIQEYPSAIAAYDEALRLDPNSVSVLLAKAGALLALKDANSALDTYRRIVALDPGNETALRESAKLLASQSRWRECLETVETLLRRRPNDVRALGLKGDVLTNLGRRPEALAAYEAAAALDPKDQNLKQKIEEVRVDVPGLLSRALIASASGNYPQALHLFDDILEVEPGNVNALIGKAVAYRRSGKPNEALNCLDMVLHYQPTNASAVLNRGHLLEEKGDLDGALEAFDKLVGISPQDEEAWSAQGDVLVKMGRDDDALHAFTEALKRNPGDEEIAHRIHDLEATRSVQADVLQELYRIKGVGPARAKALVDAGFRTAEDFQKATVEQLLAVKGITHRIAEDLVKHFRVSVPVAVR